jgi:plastocyanin
VSFDKKERFRMNQRTRRLVATALLVLGPALLTLAPATAAVNAKKPKKTITVGDNFYKAKKITVKVGDKVTWNFTGRGIHNVTVDKGPAKFHSKNRSYGYKFSKVLKKPGVYSIVCTLHPSMTMKITVTAPPPPTTATTLTPPSS